MLVLCKKTILRKIMYSPRELSHLGSSKANQTIIPFFFFFLFFWQQSLFLLEQNSRELIISHLMGVTAESTLVSIDEVYWFLSPILLFGPSPRNNGF